MADQEKLIGTDDIRVHVRERYGRLAEQQPVPMAASCCGPEASPGSSCCGSEDPAALDKVAQLYETTDVNDLPETVTNLSLGCGDPVTLASLLPGQVVLDLGSGGGIDCFLAAKQVGETGRVIGVDMTPQMIDRARANKDKLGASNVEFRLGEIEHLPAADESVDVVISNCVINLSPDKEQVFREAFRVLRPGGRLSVSDIVTDGPLPEALKKNLSAWAGCISGALEAKDYLKAIEDAGFAEVQLTPVYWDQGTVDEALEQLAVQEKIQEGHRVLVYMEGNETEMIDLGPAENVDPGLTTKAVFSAKVTARKP